MDQSLWTNLIDFWQTGTPGDNPVPLPGTLSLQAGRCPGRSTRIRSWGLSELLGTCLVLTHKGMRFGEQSSLWGPYSLTHPPSPQAFVRISHPGSPSVF